MCVPGPLTCGPVCVSESREHEDTTESVAEVLHHTQAGLTILCVCVCVCVCARVRAYVRV